MFSWLRCCKNAFNKIFSYLDDNDEVQILKVNRVSKKGALQLDVDNVM